MHTQGKWYAEGNSVRVKHSAGGWLRIALVDGGDSVYIPNALLIAAAPELLEACIMAVRYIDFILPADIEDEQIPYETLVPLKQAIAKAERS